MSDPLSTSSSPATAEADAAPPARRGRRKRLARRLRRARRGDSLFATILWAFIIAMGVRVLAFQPFHIPSESMRPALEAGDYVVAPNGRMAIRATPFRFRRMCLTDALGEPCLSAVRSPSSARHTGAQTPISSALWGCRVIVWKSGAES
jgi:hypothetical protein